MKNKRFLSICLIFVLIFALATPAGAVESTAASSEEVAQTAPVEELPTGFEKPEAPRQYDFGIDLAVQAKGAVLIELNSNSMIYSYEIDQKLYPASLTKIMTCMLALEHGDLDDVLTVSKTAMQGLSIHGSTAGLLVGEELSLREILYCIMVSSANEGCNVVAEYISGSVEEFVVLMNQKAAQLGMSGTHFANAHGLHDENHYTTVRDLSTLALWAWQNLQFREFATTTRHTVPATNLSEERLLRTTNYLTDNRVVGRYYYDKAAGIKTGFTTPAGGCLIATASDGAMTYLSVVCGCETLYDENGDPIDMRFSESKRLLKYALEKFSYVQVLSTTAMLEQLQVTGGESDRVLVHARENKSVPLPSSYDPSAITLELSYSDGQSISAPVTEGQVVGKVTAKYQGQILVESELVALSSVESLTPTEVIEPSQAPGTATEPKKESGLWETLMDYWFITLPFGIIFLLFCWLLILRAVNIRKAKKRAQRRQRRRPTARE